VFFDNVILDHITGPVLEETHYYPFGLTISGISSKAVGKLENRIKFNGIEHTTDLDINQYDAFYRTLDPQIGRWRQIDPKCEYFEDFSPYNHVLNNPISMSDPWGDDTTHVNDLSETWSDFNPEQDVVSLNGIVVTPQGSSGDWQHSGR
jgi:RHS repeat-associated protein